MPKKTKKARFATVIFSLLIGLFIWAIYGLISQSFNITDLWGIGIGAVLSSFFVTVMMGRAFGYIRAFLTMLAIIAVIFLAMLLNSTRAWPFGMSIFHDILGWQYRGIPWPLPFFWGSIIGGIFILKKPSQLYNDTKNLFSWAFDTAFLTMIISLALEPLAKISRIITWVNQGGGVLGVPLSAFLGWFITAFITVFAGMMVLKPWNAKKTHEVHYLLPLSFTGFFILTFVMATILNIALIQLLSVIFAVYFLLLTLRLLKTQDTNLIEND